MRMRQMKKEIKEDLINKGLDDILEKLGKGDDKEVKKKLDDLKKHIINLPDEDMKALEKISELVELHEEPIGKYFYGDYPNLFKIVSSQIICSNLECLDELLRALHIMEVDLNSNYAKSLMASSLLMGLTQEPGTKKVFEEIDKFLTEET